MNQTESNFVKQDLLNSSETQLLKVAPNTAQPLSEEKPPLLPRRGWQDRQAFSKILIKTKLLLEISEVDDLVARRLINKKL